MNQNDKIFDFITENQLQILRIDASIRKDILQQLKKLEKEIVLKITEEDNWQQSRLKVLLKDVQDLVKETYVVINEDMIDNLTDLYDIQAIAISGVLTVNVSQIDLSVTKIKTLVQNSLINGAPSEEWWKRQSQKLIQNFEDQMRLGILLGENNQKLIARVRGTKEFNYTNGIMNSSRNDAEALVRSSVQNAANQSRFDVFESNVDIIKSYRHVSTLDSKTSDVCIVRDGKRWDAKTKKPIDHNIPFQVPPLHWSCRSTLIAEIDGIPLANDATRASKEGPVAATMTFEEYLKGKSDSFVDEVLGKGKAQLWRDGKITLRQLLDQSGNPLTLKELRAKYT